ncbi:MAG: CoxG family protein [Calditrichia bacterium]
MKLTGEFTFQGCRSDVWDLLQDSEVLSKTLPGTRRFEKTGEDSFEAEMEIRVGPLNDVFSGTMELKDKVHPDKYTIILDSKGRAGFAKGTAFVELIEQDETTTLIKYMAELQVGGRLASVGQRMLDTVGRSLTRQSLEALDKALQARSTSGTGDAPAEMSTPTQKDFAKGVARDVVQESIQSRRPFFIAGAVIVIAIIVYILVKIL